MTRLPAIATRDQLPTEAHAAFDAIAESRGTVRGPFAVLLHSPELAMRTAHLGAFVRFESSVPDAIRELATLIGAHLWRCDYEWGAHLPLAARAGVRPEAIEAIARDADLDAFTAEEALIVRYTRALLGTHRVDAETFEAVRASYGDQALVELTAALGYYSMLAVVLNAAEVAPPTAGG